MLIWGHSWLCSLCSDRCQLCVRGSLLVLGLSSTPETPSMAGGDIGLCSFSLHSTQGSVRRPPVCVQDGDRVTDTVSLPPPGVMDMSPGSGPEEPWPGVQSIHAAYKQGQCCRARSLLQAACEQGLTSLGKVRPPSPPSPAAPPPAVLREPYGMLGIEPGLAGHFNRF